jgi:hypothetical protein
MRCYIFSKQVSQKEGLMRQLWPAIGRAAGVLEKIELLLQLNGITDARECLQGADHFSCERGDWMILWGFNWRSDHYPKLMEDLMVQVYFVIYVPGPIGQNNGFKITHDTIRNTWTLSIDKQWLQQHQNQAGNPVPIPEYYFEPFLFMIEVMRNCNTDNYRTDDIQAWQIIDWLMKQYAAQPARE